MWHYSSLPGLSGKGISLQSIKYPDRYLRHRDMKLYVEQNDDSPTFHGDATFIFHNSLHFTWAIGMGKKKARYSVSFESLNHPGFYISR